MSFYSFVVLYSFVYCFLFCHLFVFFFVFVFVFFVFFFFFSSRRRHTRYWRDWSSDVCSSDLVPFAPSLAPANGGSLPVAPQPAGPPSVVPSGPAPIPTVPPVPTPAPNGLSEIGRASCRERG